MHLPRVPLLCAASLCAAMATTFAFAADGLDPSWNDSGSLTVPMPDFELAAFVAMAPQPDARVLLASWCTRQTPSGTLTTVCMTRLLPGGERDYSFGPSRSGVLALSEFAAYPADYQMTLGGHGLLRQADGRIVVAGEGIVGGSRRAMIGRLLADGTLDPAVVAQPLKFDLPGSGVAAIAQQADGKIVVAGRTNRENTDPPNVDFLVARLRGDLSFDPTFNGTGKQLIAFDRGGANYDTAYAVAIQPDGKIVVAGYADAASGKGDLALARLNADGTLDDSFGNSGHAWFDFGGSVQLASAIRLDAANRIWIAGSVTYGSDIDFLAARVRDDGMLDTGFCGIGYTNVSFNLGGQGLDAAKELLLQADGKLVLAGYATIDSASTNFALARLQRNCSLDPAFGSGGKLAGTFPESSSSTASAAAFGGSGIVFAGSATGNGTTRFGIAHVSLDLIFANGFER